MKYIWLYLFFIHMHLICATWIIILTDFLLFDILVSVTSHNMIYRYDFTLNWYNNAFICLNHSSPFHFNKKTFKNHGSDLFWSEIWDIQRQNRQSKAISREKQVTTDQCLKKGTEMKTISMHCKETIKWCPAFDLWTSYLVLEGCWMVWLNSFSNFLVF